MLFLEKLINILTPEQNDRHHGDESFELIFVKEMSVS